MDFLSKLKALDAYPKINEDFYSRTLSGGIITLVSSVIMTVLFFNELRSYLSITPISELTVDSTRGGVIKIKLDVTFHRMSCAMLSLDAMDVSGENHLDVIHNVFKRRLSPSGKPIEATGVKHTVGEKVVKIKDKHGNELDHDNETACGSCYGAEDSEHHCCNSCKDVQEAYRRKGWAFANADHIVQCLKEGFTDQIKEQEGEGCNMYGFLEVNKVAGNFHFAPGKSFQQGGMHVHDLMPFQGMTFNVSHTITHLSFGDQFPGQHNPLDRVTWVQEGTTGMYQYFIKVVPALYKHLHGPVVSSNQFSVTEHFRESQLGQSLPGVFFFYDLSPIKVKLTEQRMSFLHFVTNVCAIVGGVFTVSGIVDAFVYHGQQAIRKKMQIGKLS